MTTLERRIRKRAEAMVVVKITRKIRSRKGFEVRYPDGHFTMHGTRREAMVAMEVAIRVNTPQVWEIKPIDWV